VHDLHPNCTSSTPDLVVIFFHGITFGQNNEWKTTWTTRETDETDAVCWPQQWLPQDLGGNIRIFSVSYDASFHGVHDDVTEIGQNLIQSLVDSKDQCELWGRPIILIGHSFGGLVIKSLVVEVGKRTSATTQNDFDKKTKMNCTRFLENLSGIVFYSVPHSGTTPKFRNYFMEQYRKIKSNTKDVAKSGFWSTLINSFWSTLINSKPKDVAKSGFWANVDTFNRQMTELAVAFEGYIKRDLIIYAFLETQPIDEQWEILLPFASAQIGAKKNFYKVETADHFTTCKPTNKNDPMYKKLLEFLECCIKNDAKINILVDNQIGK
jgi:hypothetical protein